MASTSSPADDLAIPGVAAWAALLAGNAALALGPLFVRLADTGPVSAGFWRLLLALPVLAGLAIWERRGGAAFPSRRDALLLAGAGVFFALDLASWHLGIERTRLANATLFGNAGSVLLMAWGLIRLRRRPGASEALAVLAALGGAGLLLARSLEIDRAYFVGDLFCILAGVLYTFYILGAQDARVRLGHGTVLTVASAAGAPVLLGVALALGEPVWPSDWTPVLLLALSSQIVGQGLLVYALRAFPPLIVGMALLTQPAIAAVVGLAVFDERLALPDVAGMILVGGALVLARGSGRVRTGKPVT